jgi:hypothetical protein
MRFAGDALISTPVASAPIIISMQGDAGEKAVMADRRRHDPWPPRAPSLQQ